MSSTSVTVQEEFDVLADRFTLNFLNDSGDNGSSSTASGESTAMQRIGLFQFIECLCFLVFALAILIRICVQNHNCCKKQEKQRRETPVQVQETGKQAQDDEEQNAAAADDGDDGAADSHKSAEMSGGEDENEN